MEITLIGKIYLAGIFLCFGTIWAAENQVNLPEIEASYLSKEGNTSLKQHKGRVMLVDFWATWCVPCRKSIPKLQSIQDKYPDLKIIGVNLDNSPNSAEKFMAKEKIKFANIHDADKKIADYYQVEGMPSIFLYDTSGKLIKRLDGYTEKDLSSMEEEIKKQISQVGSK